MACQRPECVSLVTTKQTLTTEKNNLSGQVTTLTTEKNSLSGQVTTLTTEKNNLSGQVTTLTNEKNNLNTQVTNLTTEKNNLNTKVTSLTTEKNNLSGQVTTLTTEKNNLSGQVTTLTNEKNNLNTQVTNLTTEKNNLSGQVTTLTTEKNNLNTQVTNLTTEKNNLSGQVTTLTNEKNNLNNQVATLTTEKNNLSGQVTTLTTEKNNLNTQVTNLTTEKNNLSSQVTTLSTEKNTLADQVANLKAENKNLASQLTELTNANKDLIEKRKELADDFNEFKIRTEKLEEELNSIIAAKEDLKISSETLQQELQEEIERLRQENESIAKENADLKVHINELQAEDNFQRDEEQFLQEENTNRLDEPIQDYDFCIPMNSLSSFFVNQFWLLEAQNDYAEKYKSRMSKKSIKAAVIGFGGAGKTFFINKLKNPKLRKVKYSKTKGISLIYPKENEVSLTLIDTPATNIAIKEGALEETIKKYFDDKRLSKEERKRMLSEDTLLMESLIEEFLFEHAEVIIVVVKRIRREDQQFLERIKARAGKPLIVVHNFMEAVSEKDLKEMMKEDIHDIFDVSQQTVFTNSNETGQNENIFYENDAKGTKHVVLGKQGTEAGNRFIASAIDYIRSVISVTNPSQEIDLPRAFAKFLNIHLAKCLISQKETQGVIEKREIEDFVTLDSNSDNKRIQREFITLEEGNKEKDSQNSHEINFNFDEEESIEGVEEGLILLKKDQQKKLFFKLNWNNPYVFKFTDEKELKKPDYTVKTNIEENTLKLEFEISGECKDDDIEFYPEEVDGDKVVLIIKGIVSNKMEKKDQKEIVHTNTRKFGEFEIITEPIPIGNLKISELEKPQFESPPGMKILTFKLLKPAINKNLKLQKLLQR